MGERPDEMTGDAKLRQHDARGRGSDDTIGRARDEVNTVTSEDTARIRSDIARTREDMSETIDAIQDRLSPRNIAAQARASVKEATVGRVRNAARTVGDSASEIAEQTRETAAEVAQKVRQNPWPVLLIGAGAAWMIADRARRRSRRASAERVYHDDGTMGYYETDLPRSGYAAGDFDTHEPGTARLAATRLRQRSSQLQHNVQGLLQRNPLVVGALATACGVAIGIVIPETERENRLMGEARDTLVERAQGAAQGAVQKAKQVAGDAAAQVAGDAAKEVVTGEKPKSR
jgi:hypothetical protein